MSRQVEIIELIHANNRRLQKLKLQKAEQGQSVDPKIVIEIEDIETALRELKAELKKIEDELVSSPQITPPPSRGVHGKSERAINIYDRSVSEDDLAAGRDQGIGGDVISVSNVGSGAAVAAGRGASARVGRNPDVEAAFTQWRAEMEAKIDALVGWGQEDKEDLKAQVAKIEKEAAKGKNADMGRLARLINVLKAMSSDIYEVAVASLANPLAGIGLVIKKTGDKAVLERQSET